MDQASTRVVDERALAAGTTARFLLLVTLLVMSSCLMLLYLFTTLTTYDAFGCSLAAGVDPLQDSVHALIVKRSLQWEAYFPCSMRNATPPPWWLPPAWLLLLATLTAALFWLLPRWKSRRVVSLEKMDPGGQVRRALDALVAKAGLARSPNFVVDPTKLSAQAVVYGRNRRPTVCLDAGLLFSREKNPQVFEAVVLHELGHVHYRDITITYLTIALWRVYALVAVPPFLVWGAAMLSRADESPLAQAGSPMVIRGLLLTVVMTAFVYLARADVLRHREFYADLAAVRWGADREVWSMPAVVTGKRRRAIRDLLRYHPEPGERRQALRDPEVLFGLRPLPIVLTGAAALMFSNQAIYALTVYFQLSRWAQYAAAAVAAALVVGVVGVALWRAVVHAVLTERRVPSGLRAGGWLGLGLILGGALTGQGTTSVWVPDRPVVLVLVVLTAVVFACWTTRCAFLWVSAWRGRTLRPVLALSLTTATLALATWFSWWQTQGVGFVAGATINIAGIRDVLAANYTGRTLDKPPLATVDHVYALTQLIIDNLAAPPPALVSVIALWGVLLLAWLIRPTGPARWARDAVTGLDPDTAVGTPLPALRRLLLPGLLGGVVAWAATAGVAAYLHVRLASGTSATRFFTVQVTLSLLALLAGGTIAAAVACAWGRAHRLPAALIAGQVAILLGLAGFYLRGAVDGCVEALSTTTSACGWHPWAVNPTFTFFVVPAVVLGVVASTVVAAVAALSARTGTSQPPAGRTAARRVAVLALCLVAFGLGAVRAVALSPQAAAMPSPAEMQRVSEQWWRAAESSGPPAPRTLALQIDAWAYLGGNDLIHRFFLSRRYAFATVTANVNNGKRGVSGLGAVAPLCAEISGVAKDAARYFRVPDPDTQRLWEKFIVQAWQGAQACGISLDRQDSAGFDVSMRTLAEAGRTSRQIDDRIDALRKAGR